MSFNPFQPVCLAASAVPVSISGATAITTLYSFTLKANTLGPRDFLEIYALFSFTNSASVKTATVSIGASNRLNLAGTNNSCISKLMYVLGRNSLTAQVCTPSGNAVTYGNTGAREIGAIDTTVDNIIAWKGTLATADTMAFEAGFVKKWSVL